MSRSSVLLRPMPMLVLLLVPALASSAAAVDTFYLRLFDDGRALAAGGEPVAAADKLRLACFGMLDEPRALAPCLGHLLLALDAAGAATDDVEAVVDRLLEVEQRFQGWSEAERRFDPGASLRGRVDGLMARFAAADTLARTPGFDGAALRKEADRVAALPPEERRRELNLLVQKQSDAVIWHVLSAELSFDEGEERAAVRAVDEILRELGDGDAADLDAARCVRGRARAGLGSCGSEVVEELELCAPDHRRRADVDEALAVCLAEAERWREARDALQRLPADRRDRRDLKKLQRRVDEALGGENHAALPAAAVDDGAEPIYAPPPGMAVRQTVEEDATETEIVDRSPERSAGSGDVLARVRDALDTERRDDYAVLWPDAKRAARKGRSAEASRLAGDLAFRLGRWRDAIRHLEDDGEMARERPDLQLGLAIALYYDGRIDDARQAFEQARPGLSQSAWVGFWARELAGEG